jgi:hypothetical protein
MRKIFCWLGFHSFEYKISPYFDLHGVMRVCKVCNIMQWRGDKEWARFK